MITLSRPSSRLLLYTAALCLTPAAMVAGGKEMASRPVQPVNRNDGAQLDTCGQQAAQRLMGLLVTPQVRTELQKSIRHDRMRIVRPGAVITQDVRPDRLNLIVDDSGRLVAARCG